MKTFAIIAAALAASVAPAFAVDLDHNGSRMQAHLSGNRVVVDYAEPRKGIADVVRPGTNFFIGTIRAGVIEGQATAFKKGCPQIAYSVSGTVDGGTIELHGPAPVRKGCAFTLSESSPHSRLVLTGDPEQIATLDADAGRARTGAEMATILRPGTSTTPERPQPAAETAAPIAATVTRDEPRPAAIPTMPPPALDIDDAEVEPTPDQADEAEAEREIYAPAVGETPATVPAPVAGNAASPPASVAPMPPAAEPKKLDIDL